MKSISMLTRFALCGLLLLIAGCDAGDALIQEMEYAYIAAGKSSETKDAYVSNVAKRHFPDGMLLSDALTQLQARGFKIIEYRYEGARIWPSGDLRPYKDESVRRNIQARFRKNQIEHVAEKEFEWRLFVAKRAVIVIDSDSEKILSSRGFIYLNGI